MSTTIPSQIINYIARKPPASIYPFFSLSIRTGHKILKVITGDADLYLLSKNTTFKWDTCGPQAILNAIEGGLFKIEEIIESGQIIEVDYDDERPNLNEGGLLALRREEKHILQDLYNKK